MIYLDNNATTLLDPEVFTAMQPLLTSYANNPSSVHRYGQRAKALFTEALKQCACFFKVRTDELVFTSGATEALNFLIRSAPKGSHIITSSLEHAAVLEPLKICGCEVTYLDPKTGYGAIHAAQVKEAIRENTRMIVLTAANNETGIKTEIDQVATLVEDTPIRFVIDGVASLAKETYTLPQGVWAACFSGHKIHAPLGVGVAVIRKTYKACPYIVGGPQQRGMRAGTENLPAIVGFAKALEQLTLHGKKWIDQMTVLRDRLETGLLEAIPEIVIHGKDQPRVCNTSHIAFPEIDGETLSMALDLAGLAASHGAACSSGTLEPSRVLLNMGISPTLARSSLRFSLSRYTTAEEIEKAVSIIAQAAARLRGCLIK